MPRNPQGWQRIRVTPTDLSPGTTAYVRAGVTIRRTQCGAAWGAFSEDGRFIVGAPRLAQVKKQLEGI